MQRGAVVGIVVAVVARAARNRLTFRRQKAERGRGMMEKTRPSGRPASNREFFLKCWHDEYPTILKVLKAVPPDRLDYRPDPKSRSAAELVWLQVLEKRCWFEMLETGRINWVLSAPPASLGETIAAYEQAHAVVAHLLAIDDAAWETRSTQFLIDGRVYIETTLGHMFWIGPFDAIHHRGQLSVYLRPMGGRVPSIYGPSADDPGL
jgi:uncharacterized damage-inducible protein DinB